MFPLHLQPINRLQRLLGPCIFGGLLLLTPAQANPEAFGEGEAVQSPIREITIRDIAAQIKSHVKEESSSNAGRFQIEHEGETLDLTLIRVHMEYLANLGDGVQFACVDLVEADGTVYDVDFFLAGNDPEDLSVTETHVHKLDGQPLYAWEQKEDDTWHRVAIEGARDELMGVVRGEDFFHFTYRCELPQLDEATQLWVPLAQSDDFQKVRIEKIVTPAPWDLVADRSGENAALAMQVGPEHSGRSLEIRYQVARVESGPYAKHPTESPAQHLAPESLVPADPTFTRLAREALDGSSASTDLMRARELYKHTLETMRYQRYGDGWGEGNAVYACDAKTGNCSDFHSYFIALCRAVDIPARFVIGAAIPSDRDEGGINGYHCWAEFYADGDWWPIDISEADKYQKLADYYFGKKPANRFELSRGRDLVFEGMRSGQSFNFLVYPVLEDAGGQTSLRPVFEFERPAKTMPEQVRGEAKARGPDRPAHIECCEHGHDA